MKITPEILEEMKKMFEDIGTTEGSPFPLPKIVEPRNFYPIEKPKIEYRVEVSKALKTLDWKRVDETYRSLAKPIFDSLKEHSRK